jgi:hypothetical protein
MTEPRVDSITNLLKAHDVALSAVKANKILLELGILAEKERPSSKDPRKMKKFKALTEHGLKYGINRENISTPDQTSPYYYVETFGELLVLIKSKMDKT